MATINIDAKCDLNKPVVVRHLDGMVFSQDVKANMIRVSVFRDREPVDLSGGSVSANIIRADGATVVQTGTIEGNVCSVVLPSSAYAVPGQIAIFVKHSTSAGPTTSTIAAITGYVYKSTTDTIVDPGSVVPNVNQLLAMIEDCEDATAACIAATAAAPVIDDTAGAGETNKVWSAGKSSELKDAFDEVSAFNETLGYIPPSFTNSDFVPGMYANGSWRGDGNYAKSRTIHELIPLDDFVITAETETYTGLVLTLQLWDSSNQYLATYKVGGPNGIAISTSDVIQTGSYEFFKSEALNTNASAAYITVSVGKLVSGAWADLPTDLVLELRKQDGKAESIIRTVEKLTDAVERNVNVVDLNKQKTVVYGKYIKPDGTYGSASSHKVVTFKIKNVKQIGVHALGNTGAAIAVIEDAEGNVVTSLGKPYYYEAETKYDLSLVKDQEYTVFFNFFSYNTIPNPFFDSVNIYYKNAIDFAVDQVEKNARKTAIELPRHSVFKPFSFNGKTAAFFGDSITVGVINGDGSQVTTLNYPNGFSAKVGLTPTNKAVSGSRIYVPSGVSAAKILSQLQSVTLSDYDFIFISGGINDFMAYTVDQMLIGLTELISYVKANFTGDVIWITPISTAKNVADAYNNKKDLNDYISAMTKLIKESDSNYQFSVVQGWEFGFPTLDSDSAYKNAMFGDGELHPSELGYNTLYVPGLLTALC